MPRFNGLFIHDIRQALNFPVHFTKIIMECITTPSYTLSINGISFGFFKGKRGLRQGDPMSPLIFTLVMEYFSRLLSSTSNVSSFKYHPMCKHLQMTHLLFADDLFLFCRGDLKSVTVFLSTQVLFSSLLFFCFSSLSQ